MKFWTSTLTALVILSFLVTPFGVEAQKLKAPKEYTVQPGAQTIRYAAKTLKVTLTFTTNVGLRVQLRATGPGTVLLRFIQHPNWLPADGGGHAETSELVIYWKEKGEVIYDDAPPTTEWEELVLTEGGWTEK